MPEKDEELLEQTEQSEIAEQPEEEQEEGKKAKKGKKKKEKKAKGEKKAKKEKPKKLKTNINLIVNKRAETNKKIMKALPFVLGFLAIFIGVGIVWPLIRINKAATLYHEKEKELETLQTANADYEDVLYEYNHLFGIFMSPAERNNTHRMEIIDMLNDDLIYDIPIKGFRVTENSITANTDATDLAAVQERLKILKEDERNQYAAFTTATIKDEKKGDELIATFRITFKSNNNANVELKVYPSAETKTEEPVTEENPEAEAGQEGGN